MNISFKLLFLLLIASCRNNTLTSIKSSKMIESTNYNYTNKLIHETSPYLLQHAHNPVDWYPWGDEALEKAKTENKLLIVSIGYSACHWCHVMEKESFENEEVARLMNAHFICIKVDREERPDIDNIYMDAVHLMGRQGGWPLNCIALPDGRPVFGGTYFQKENWIEVLQKVNELFVNEREQLHEYAERLSDGLKQQAIMHINTREYEFNEDNLNEMVFNWSKSFDMKWGGSQGAPKFPMPNGISFLLQYYYFTRDEEVKDYVELTLDKMASGGIYDHIGGGFTRYSTDEYWMVPHFEKMLYDNAQMIGLYSEAYKLFKKDRYKDVVYETVEFLNSELTNKSGGIYSALDADSEGVEGKFYVWTIAEIEEILKRNAPIFIDYFNLTKTGNWEQGVNVIHNEIELKKIAKQYSISVEEAYSILKNSKQLLLDVRNKRIRPRTDTKILTAWNALAITALVDAYRAFGEKDFLDKSIELGKYFKNTHIAKDGTVKRMLKKDAEDISGFLDDYALLAQAYLSIYEATFDEAWLKESRKISDMAIKKFFDPVSGMFFYHISSDSSLFSTKQEIQDNVIPSSNSVMANVLFKLGLYFENPDYTSKAEKMLSGIYPNLSKYGPYYSNWGKLLIQFVFQPPEVVIVGSEAIQKRWLLDRKFLYVNLSGSEKGSELPLLRNRYQSNKTMVYVCRNGTCKLPVESIEDVLKQIEN